MNCKVTLNSLNPHLMCVLCGGYYIDATTIVECLHSFCKSCIVKHLESSKYCPICDVQIHKTKPLLNIKQDAILQDIVYKLVPGLFQTEMRMRRGFYKDHPHYIKPEDSEQCGEIYTDHYHSHANDKINICLAYDEASPSNDMEITKEISNKRYFQCPSGVSISQLKKLIKAKYELNGNSYKVDIACNNQSLSENLSLLDVSYIHRSPRKSILELRFRIYEYKLKKRKLEEKSEELFIQENKSEEKEKNNENKKDKEIKEDFEKEMELNGTDVEKEIKENVVHLKKEIKESLSENKIVEKSSHHKINNEKEKEIQLQISENGEITATEITITDKIEKEKEFKSPNKIQKVYKTIRCAPKVWHPVIPKEKLRPTLLKSSVKEDSSPKKPLKFFKMRNMPRFLGNPSSGVKPIYAEDKADKNEIVRIDPKTLRPIEKKMDLKPTNLLTSPFIPNNHFLFSDVQHLPPSPIGDTIKKPSGSKEHLNGSSALVHNDFFKYPPNPGFFPVNDTKFNPLFRAASMSPFSLNNLHMAGFHSSLPPSISLLFSPHHHFKSIQSKSGDADKKKIKISEICDNKNDVSGVSKSASSDQPQQIDNR